MNKKDYKITDDNGITTYYFNGVKKYVDENRNNYDEYYRHWYEYDKDGNEIYRKCSDGRYNRYEYDEKGKRIYERGLYGDEWWDDNHPNNPEKKRKKIPKDFIPFTFSKKYT